MRIQPAILWVLTLALFNTGTLLAEPARPDQGLGPERVGSRREQAVEGGPVGAESLEASRGRRDLELSARLDDPSIFAFGRRKAEAAPGPRTGILGSAHPTMFSWSRVRGPFEQVYPRPW